jgi:hypothetical protein
MTGDPSWQLPWYVRDQDTHFSDRVLRGYNDLPFHARDRLLRAKGGDEMAAINAVARGGRKTLKDLLVGLGAIL